MAVLTLVFDVGVCGTICVVAAPSSCLIDPFFLRLPYLVPIDGGQALDGCVGTSWAVVMENVLLNSGLSRSKSKLKSRYQICIEIELMNRCIKEINHQTNF